LRDAQCWLLCGERSAALARDAIGQHLAVVGTTPRWGCFYRAVRAWGSLPLPDDASGFLANVAPMARQAADMVHGGKPAEWREAIGADAIRKLEQINQADFELYDYVAREREGLIINAA
jgi:hypothetical protein